MEIGITREAALALLKQYNKEPFHLRHALTVEAVMDWYAEAVAAHGVDAVLRAAPGPQELRRLAAVLLRPAFEIDVVEQANLGPELPVFRVQPGKPEQRCFQIRRAVFPELHDPFDAADIAEILFVPRERIDMVPVAEFKKFD